MEGFMAPGIALSMRATGSEPPSSEWITQQIFTPDAAMETNQRESAQLYILQKTTQKRR
jgi:hypothetical protein